MRRALADPRIEARRKEPVPKEVDPAIEVLVQDIIGKVADKWTMLILEALHEHGTLRFTQLGKAVGRISQKMLTQTLRGLERHGMVDRAGLPTTPPQVEYSLTPLGRSFLATASVICAWTRDNIIEITECRERFDLHKNVA